MSAESTHISSTSESGCATLQHSEFPAMCHSVDEQRTIGNLQILTPELCMQLTSKSLSFIVVLPLDEVLNLTSCTFCPAKGRTCNPAPGGGGGWIMNKYETEHSEQQSESAASSSRQDTLQQPSNQNYPVTMANKADVPLLAG